MSQIKTSHSIEKLEQSLLDSINLILKTTGDSADDSPGDSAVFNVGLSGGSIISILANILPRLQTDLSRWRFYFCDERVVPVESADSTYGAYLKQFADQQIAVERRQFVKINEQLPLEECAQQYAGLIEEGVPKNSDGVPAFDLLFLGMGPDGHTCSLFPNHPALEVNDKLVTHVDDSPKPPPQRITFTYKLLNSAKNVIFLATGKAKQTIVREIFIEGKDYPASRVKARNVIWFLDNDSSALLPTQFTT